MPEIALRLQKKDFLPGSRMFEIHFLGLDITIPKYNFKVAKTSLVSVLRVSMKMFGLYETYQRGYDLEIKEKFLRITLNGFRPFKQI